MYLRAELMKVIPEMRRAH